MGECCGTRGHDRTKLSMLKEFTLSIGLDPEHILVKDALAEPHRILTNPEDDPTQFEALGQALKKWIKREALKAEDSRIKRYTLQNSMVARGRFRRTVRCTKDTMERTPRQIRVSRTYNRNR